jgi:glycosyltransferase involved in cell wall biosynthesis
MRREKISAVLTFTHHANLLGIPISWLSGVPVRVASHRGRIYGFPRWQEWLHSQMINLGMANCLLALSEGVRQEAIREGVKPERVIVIHNGVEMPSLDQDSRSRIRKELNVPDGALLLLSTGRFAPEKGHSILLQAMPGVLERNIRVVFVFAGEGPLRPELEKMARKLGVDSQVRVLGLRQDVLELAHAADLFVMPSISEGLGQALLEAMSVGTPVLASNVGGIPELITDGVTGHLVRPSDPGALADAISDLLGNEIERRRLGMAGKQVIAEHFTLDRMCQKYARLLLGEGAGTEGTGNP